MGDGESSKVTRPESRSRLECDGDVARPGGCPSRTHQRRSSLEHQTRVGYPFNPSHPPIVPSPSSPSVSVIRITQHIPFSIQTPFPSAHIHEHKAVTLELLTSSKFVPRSVRRSLLRMRQLTLLVAIIIAFFITLSLLLMSYTSSLRNSELHNNVHTPPSSQTNDIAKQASGVSLGLLETDISRTNHITPGLTQGHAIMPHLANETIKLLALRGCG